VRENPWLQLRGRQHVCLSRIAQLDQRTALPDQCLHSAEADMRRPRGGSGIDPEVATTRYSKPRGNLAKFRDLITGSTSANAHIAASDVCDGTSAVGESRDRKAHSLVNRRIVSPPSSRGLWALNGKSFAWRRAREPAGRISRSHPPEWRRKAVWPGHRHHGSSRRRRPRKTAPEDRGLKSFKGT
jgi:hypothetical protein